MKRTLKVLSIGVLILFSIFGCSDFDEINTQPDAFPPSEVSAKYFLTTLQVELYSEGRFPYWRGQLIHADRFAGQVTFGFNGSFWSDGLAYSYDPGYTDAAYDWMAGYVSKLSAYMNFVKPGGDLENERFYALGLIMKGLYYQMYSDTFGMVPYSEASDPDIITPKFDTQAQIYEGVINDLDAAMATIGDGTETGEGIELLAENDLLFNGNLQQWKKLANTLKLRMALRALGADGADFAQTAITEAMQAPLLTTGGADAVSDKGDDNALLEKDTKIDQFTSAAYGDIWYNFGQGSNWLMSKTLIDYLRDNNDPRLQAYARPIQGGEIVFTKPDGDNGSFDKYVNFLLKQLDDAGVVYTKTAATGMVTVNIDDSKPYYVGQPTRLNEFIMPQVKYELFSQPAEWIINEKNKGNEIFPEVVMTAAEGNYLQAEAVIKGMGSGDAQALYQEGIRQAMRIWRVNDSDIENFIATQDMALLNGTPEQNLEKIAIQRWIADFTDGFEAWAVVRDTGYPSELAQGVSDFDFYSAGTLNGKYPQRMRYGNAEYNTNGAQVQAAIQQQGPDEQATKLWWAKK